MRRKPVTRSEIRFDGTHICTMPADAVTHEKGGWLEYVVPIPKLWAPLLRALKVSPPERRLALALRPRACPHCGREFYRLWGNIRYCSDDCAKASRRDRRATNIAAFVKARSEARAAARADRRCANPDCNKPLTAQRSTSKFCSVRCRVAAHRERSVPDGR